jgi:hypothetical protein
MDLTPAAQKLWDGLPTDIQRMLLNNVWCGTCREMGTMLPESGKSVQGDLVLRGTCATCGGPVGRLIETSEQPTRSPSPSDFTPGETVIWWKRLPGGDYVYPVHAKVLAITAKRVKVEADDDGALVVRYVPPESLERRGS